VLARFQGDAHLTQILHLGPQILFGRRIGYNNRRPSVLQETRQGHSGSAQADHGNIFSSKVHIHSLDWKLSHHFSNLTASPFLAGGQGLIEERGRSEFGETFEKRPLLPNFRVRLKF
jgi:hypothetical protein